MHNYVALIRGINVGGKNTLPMKELVAALESIGCSNVHTYIQSGNVVFQSNSSAGQLADTIAAEIERRQGFKPHVLVLSQSEFEQAINNNPFPEGMADPKSLHFGFLDSIPRNPDMNTLEIIRAPSERFELAGKIFYLLAPDGVGRSKLAMKSEKALGVPMTDRNVNTVGKIMTMLEKLEK